MAKNKTMNLLVRKVLFCTMVYFSIVFLVLFLFKKENYRYQLSIIAIFQNEERFLKEWLDFYRVMGVEHFYLFNHLSDDHYLGVLQPYIQAGLVELIDWPYPSRSGCESDWTKIQSAAYRKGLHLAKGSSKWVALLDTDEFLFPKDHPHLVAFLENYAECSSILINWQLFGTSHIERIPPDRFMIETLLKHAPVNAKVNTYCKSIVRPEKVKYCNDPHSVIHYPWSYAVDPDKYIFHWKFHPYHPVKTDKIQINHYWARDEEFFRNRKLARYEQWGCQREACLAKNQEANQLESGEILAWIPKLRDLPAIVKPSHQSYDPEHSL